MGATAEPQTCHGLSSSSLFICQKLICIHSKLFRQDSGRCGRWLARSACIKTKVLTGEDVERGLSLSAQNWVSIGFLEYQRKRFIFLSMKKKYGVLSQNIWKIPKKVRLLFDLDWEKKWRRRDTADNMKNKPSFLLGLVMHSALMWASHKFFHDLKVILGGMKC
jgi:hypothetical protein